MASTTTRAESLQADCKPDAPTNLLRVYYLRKDKKYKGWGLHVWGDVEQETAWTRAMEPTGELDGGVYFDIPVRGDQGSVGLLIHKGDEKAAGGMVYKVSSNTERWLYDSEVALLDEAPDLDNMPVGNLLRSYCHWVDSRTLVWRVSPTDETGQTNSFQLHSRRDAGLKLDAAGIQGADRVIPLEFHSKQLDPTTAGKFPHLHGCITLKLPEQFVDSIPELVKGQLAVSVVGSDGKIQDNTGVQIPGVLDDIFFYDGELGDVFDVQTQSHEIRVWAPTAQNVQLLHWKELRGGDPSVHDMTPGSQGVWSFKRPKEWTGQCYKYRITAYCPWNTHIEVMETTDPYSRCTTANGERSIMVDLHQPELLPPGWKEHTSPSLASWTDVSLYELHIRDFSANDSTVPAALKGKYLAFSPEHVTATSGSLSNGLKHLQRLRAAGMNHIHLLPTYDYGSVPERPEEQLEVQEDLSQYPPDSEVPQSIIASICDNDAFNWGYDPVHYSVPEGSYSTNPDGTDRVLEFRQMVKSLHELGFRVVLDVVYNHTFRSGPTDSLSVLDKVVPGYYHRRGEDGSMMNSTCCNNTASEHLMCEKLLVDDAVHWAKVYKIPARNPAATDPSLVFEALTGSWRPAFQCAAVPWFKHNSSTRHLGLLSRATSLITHSMLSTSRHSTRDTSNGDSNPKGWTSIANPLFKRGLHSVYSARTSCGYGCTQLSKGHAASRGCESRIHGQNTKFGLVVRQGQCSGCRSTVQFGTQGRGPTAHYGPKLQTGLNAHHGLSAQFGQASVLPLRTAWMAAHGAHVVAKAAASSSGDPPSSSSSSSSSPSARGSPVDSNSAPPTTGDPSAAHGDAASPSPGSPAPAAEKTGLWGMMDRWNKRSAELNDKLRSLGIAGIVAYGMLNTLYYTCAFLFFWVYVAKVPAGLGIAGAAGRFLEVFGLVWAGSQVTKLARAAGAVVLAPVADKVLGYVMDRLRLKSKQQAFLVLVGGCIVGALCIFGLTVMVYA